jgi:hypothetical protein
MSLPTTTCWMFLLWMRRPAANETGYGWRSSLMHIPAVF